MKKVFVTAAFLVNLALFVFAGRLFCYEGEIEDISGSKYFPAVKEAITEARESIYMVMFKVGLRPYDESSSVYKLVEELVNAHKRGVEVAVILDQNIPFIGKEHIDDWEIEGKNAWCYKRLKESGINVGYDDAVNYTHAKTLVIDKEIIILGSANWTESALHRNFETNVLIKSKDLAQELLEQFEKIKIEEPGKDTKDIKPPIPLSWEFLEDPKLAGAMMTKHDERAFDLYLLLLRDFDGNKEGVITLDYDKMAKSLGLSQDLDRTGYRRQIIRSSKTLENKYNLIEFKPQYAENAVIRLKDYDSPDKAYSYPDEWYFEIPANYWEYGWDRKLSMRAKFCYLILLAYAGISDAKPWWFASRDVLSKRFNVGIWMISKGMQELRKWNLIDVAYDELGQDPGKGRLAKSYKALPLYDPEELEKEWDSLILKYGGEKVQEARTLAEIVFEENAPAIVEDIIKEIDRLGINKVKEAFDIIAKKNIDNPKRCYQYVKGILRNF
jgi:hypothetical protein